MPRTRPSTAALQNKPPYSPCILDLPAIFSRIVSLRQVVKITFYFFFPIMPVPDLPVLAEENSALSRKFGRETANYFSGSPLNRLSFLRTDHGFLQSAFSHPSAAFLLVNNLCPLVTEDPAHLAFVSNADVVPLTGPEPFAKKEEDLINDFNSEETQPVILFLGVDDKNRLTSHNAGAPEEFVYKTYKGSPYFAVDVTPRDNLTEAANALIDAVKARGFSFHDSSPRHMGLHADQGQKKSLC